jgi:uncharacterized membrane protein YkvA (DUF1232 family)
MLFDYLKGEYKDLSATGLATIILSLLYLIFPVDFIPDFIPFAGQGDDLIILYIAYMLLQDDIDKYKKWKNKEK